MSSSCLRLQNVFFIIAYSLVRMALFHLTLVFKLHVLLSEAIKAKLLEAKREIIRLLLLTF